MKAVSIIRYLFSAIGIGLLIGAFFLYRNTSTFLASAVRTEGTVVELVQSRSRSRNSTVYKPVFRFADRQGREISVQSSSGSNPAGYEVGERVDVFYLPDDPHKARIDGYFSLWGGATIVCGIGAFFLLIGLGTALVPMLGARRDQHLRRNGTPVSTQLQGVELNQGVRMKGRHPFRVITQWQDPATSRVHVFRSHNLWYDPAKFLDGKPITVFMEPGNPGKYLVDLSFLPELAE